MATLCNSNLKIVKEKGTATQFSVLTCRIPWTVKPGRFESMGHKESDTTEQLTRTGNWVSLVSQTVKDWACKAREPVSIPGSGRSHGEGEVLHTPIF